MPLDHAAYEALFDTGRFTAIEGAPDFIIGIGPLRKGKWIEVPVHLEYRLRGGGR